MKSIWFFLVLLFSFSTFAQEVENSKIVIGINSDYSLPLVGIRRFENNPTLDSGILKDLGEAIADELKIQPSWVLLPKKRVAPTLLAGHISFICHLNEAWQEKIKDDVLWSHDLYRSVNVIVHLKKKTIHSLSELNGERIGVVLNFVYKGLDNLFQKNTLLREDGPNNDSNIQKLLSGRINYIVMSNLEYNYYKKKHAALDFTDFGMDSVMTKCALSPKSNLKLNELNHAIDTIKRNGTLDKILKSY
ncbi:MAG: substrate-binding periplasmic protein [Bdellovibrio sp.]